MIGASPNGDVTAKDLYGFPNESGADKAETVIVIQNRQGRQAVNTWLGMALLDLRPVFREMAIAKCLSLQLAFGSSFFGKRAVAWAFATTVQI